MNDSSCSKSFLSVLVSSFLDRKKIAREKKLQKNSSDDEKAVQQQIPTIEAKSANANEKITSTAVASDNKAAANV